MKNIVYLVYLVYIYSIKYISGPRKHRYELVGEPKNNPTELL